MHNYAPFRVNINWAVSLSQLCATQHNTGSPMLSNVSIWRHMQYFFKSCLAIATTGLCSVSLMRMHWRLVPQNRTNAILHNNLVGFVGCWRRQFRRDIDVSDDMLETCQKMSARHSATSAFLVPFFAHQCCVVFMSCRHVGMYIGRN
jgi:hypothetical protein